MPNPIITNYEPIEILLPGERTYQPLTLAQSPDVYETGTVLAEDGSRADLTKPARYVLTYDHDASSAIPANRAVKVVIKGHVRAQRLKFATGDLASSVGPAGTAQSQRSHLRDYGIIAVDVDGKLNTGEDR